MLLGLGRGAGVARGAVRLTLKMDDTPGGGGFTIEVEPPVVSTPLKLTMTSSGIEITNSAAKISLSPASVSINDGALEVI